MDKKKLSFAVLLFMALLFVFAQNCFASQPTKPMLKIIVEGSAKDLSISMEMDENIYRVEPKKTAWETSYNLYYWGAKEKFNIIVNSGTSALEFEIDTSTLRRDDVMTLNMTKQTLVWGEPKYRSVFLVSLRLLLILLLQSALFWLLGFRKKKNWVIFLVINATIYAVLNIWINGFSVVHLEQYMPHVHISLIFASFCIFIFEIFAFPIPLREKELPRSVGFVFLSNIASYIAMNLMIQYLPI